MYRSSPCAPTVQSSHSVFSYPVKSVRQGRELARRIRPILERLGSTDATLAALVTAQAVTVTVAFSHVIGADMATQAEIHQSLLPTLSALISGIMVNDLVCRHLDPAPRFYARLIRWWR